MAKVVDKKVRLRLVGLDGNVYSLMGAFQRQAREEGWSSHEILAVIEECMEGSYEHLLQTLMDHCEEPDVEDEEDE